MNIYKERPAKLRESIDLKYKLEVCFDEKLERLPKIAIKNLTETEIDNYVEVYKLIHNIIYQQEVDNQISTDLRRFLNNEKINTKLIRKTFNFLEQNISKSLSHIYQETKKYDAIFVLFDIIYRLKMRRLVLSIYPLIVKIKRAIIYNCRYSDTPQEELPKIRAINLNYDDIQTNINKLKSKKDKMLFAIYHLFPTRLSKEYNIMYVKKTNEDTYNKVNYYDYVKKEFIFNITKYSINKNPRQLRRFPLSKELYSIIDDYIEEEELKHNYKLMLFPVEKRLSQVFKKIYGTEISSLQMKKTYLLYFFANYFGDDVRFSLSKLIIMYFIMGINYEEFAKTVWCDISSERNVDVKYCKLILLPLIEYVKSKENKYVIDNTYYRDDFIR